MTKGWYWVLVRGLVNYEWREEWIVVEFDKQWKWDWEALKRKGLSDITTAVSVVGPIERAENG